MSAQDGAPRTVHLPVVIRTWGTECVGRRIFDESCDFFRGGTRPECALFDERIRYTGRCPACLALDPAAPDLSPEDVVRHDFGSQP